MLYQFNFDVIYLPNNILMLSSSSVIFSIIAFKAPTFSSTVIHTLGEHYVSFPLTQLKYFYLLWCLT